MSKPVEYEAVDAEGDFIAYRIGVNLTLEQNTSKSRPVWQELAWSDFSVSTLTPSELRALANVKERPYG